MRKQIKIQARDVQNGDVLVGSAVRVVETRRTAGAVVVNPGTAGELRWAGAAMREEVRVSRDPKVRLV